MDVQFKTGRDRAMPDYEVGDVAEDITPDLYDGIADAYCAQCQSRWSDDERRIHFDLLANDVGSGRVTARRATWRHGILDGHPELGLVVTATDDAPMTATDVLALAEVPETSLRKSFTARIQDVALWLGDTLLHPSGEDFERASEWWIRRHDEVATRLRALGWKEGAEPTIDVRVLVDTNHRVRLSS